MSKLIIIAIPDHQLRFKVIRLLSENGYGFICAKNLPKLCHEITNVEEECLLIIDIFAYSSPMFKAIDSLGVDKKLKSVFLMDEEGMRHSQRFKNDGMWYSVEKEYLNKQLTLVMDQIYGKQTAQKEESPNNKKEVYSMPEKGERLLNKAFGRRSFLKGTAAAAAVTGVTVASPGNMVMKALAAESEEAAAANEEKIFYGCCRGNCMGGCHLKITVRNGKVVKTTMGEMPDPRYNRICSKGISHAQRIYSPMRIKHPMKRVGERGSGEWQQITWDEAIQEICSTWKRLQTNYGKSSVVFSNASGNHELMYYDYPSKLQKLMGASKMATCYDLALEIRLTGICGASYNYSFNNLDDLVNARTILIWGANPTEAQKQNWHFIAEAQSAGAKIVVIDPNITITARKADKHLAIRPGTDAALAMGMINIAIEEGFEDANFLKRSTVAPFLVKSTDKKFLRSSDLGVLTEGAQDSYIVMDKNGKTGLVSDVTDPVIHGTFTVNGLQVTTAYDLLLANCAEWTAEKVAEICDVSIDDIKEVTRLYANGPSTIYNFLGIDHYSNGTQAYLGCESLACVTGNMGKPGASCGGANPNVSFLQNFADLSPEGFPGGPIIAATVVPETVKNKNYFGTPMELKSLYIYGHNLLGNQSDRKAWLDVFNNMELVVVADIQETDTTRYADIVLPVTHWFETKELFGSNTPFFQYQEQAIDPLYEAKNDFDIINLLGKGMGFESYFTKTLDQHHEQMLDSDWAKSVNITLDRLKKEKVIQAAPSNYIYGGEGVFSTATGRIQFFTDAPAPVYGVIWDANYDLDKERTLNFQPPIEAWPVTAGGYEKNPLADKYPLIIITEKHKFKTHTQFGHNPWLLEVMPEPIVKMNPEDASARGIAEGDYVKVFNDRGYVVLKAVLHAGARPGVILVPKGWEVDQFKDGHYSDLSSRFASSVGHLSVPNNCYFDCLVEVMKA